ncbi:MAG: DeoR/GlpR family DNA-binding transcription regulator [Oscillospiraceae bacterium]|nr:DeoR/GlpR family DNA-binding transcription regulator [Oscillospiraceae bacterium]
MLTEERHSIILDTVNKNKNVELGELCELLNTSESTVRRDLSLLDKKGLLVKVRGGAIAVADESFTAAEPNVEEKSGLFAAEKEAIARYAASLIEDGDFVYIDAGTTTEKMIEYIPSKSVTFVTNAFINAKKLAQRGFKVMILAGEVKASTEAIVGSEAAIALMNYNFTKCFMGVNGISIKGGLSTPDKNEASVKTMAVSRSKEVFILGDHSKFGKIFPVKFSELNRGKIITDKVPDKKYLSEASVKEVL